MNHSDLWVLPPTASPTKSVAGAGVTAWGSVVIDNGSGLDLAVSNSPGAPPAGLIDAWQVVSPGSIVTLPLGTAGVAYRVIGTPLAGARVQTTLSTTGTAGGGSPGSVVVTGGVVNVTGPVSVQTAAGVNLQAAFGLAGVTTMSINAGTTSLSIPVLANVQRLVLQRGDAFPGGDPLPFIQVKGDVTGTNYHYGYIPVLGQTAVSLSPSGGGINVDPSVTVTIFAGVAGGTLVVVQSYAPPALSASDLFPTEEWGPTASGEKNLYVRDVGGKLYAQDTIVGASQSVVLIPIPPANNYISLQEIVFYNDIVQAGSFLQIGGGAAANDPILTSDPAVVAGHNRHLHLHGFTLGAGRELRATTNVGATPTWRIRVVYALVWTA